MQSQRLPVGFEISSWWYLSRSSLDKLCHFSAATLFLVANSGIALPSTCACVIQSINTAKTLST